MRCLYAISIFPSSRSLWEKSPSSCEASSKKRKSWKKQKKNKRRVWFLTGNFESRSQVIKIPCIIRKKLDCRDRPTNVNRSDYSFALEKLHPNNWLHHSGRTHLPQMITCVYCTLNSLPSKYGPPIKLNIKISSDWMSSGHPQKDVNKILTLSNYGLNGSPANFLSLNWPSPLKILIYRSFSLLLIRPLFFWHHHTYIHAHNHIYYSLCTHTSPNRHAHFYVDIYSLSYVYSNLDTYTHIYVNTHTYTYI